MIAILAAKSGVMVETLDQVARARFGGRTSGVSSGPTGVTLWLDDTATEIEKADAVSILAGVNTLALTVDKAAILADGADQATIQVAMGDPEFDYTVWLDGTIYADGHDAVAGGQAVVELTSMLAGTFVVEIRRRIGDFASGHVTVVAE